MAYEGECAVTVVTAQDHTFELNEEDLKSILLKDEIKDKNVVVVSVAGAFRKGKSFLLNFLLRYLEANGSSVWLGEESVPLKGFSWRGGSERDTTGILIWNRVFIIPLRSGEEVAVVLMDTQGAFDSSSTVKECATVFALSTMLSSIQVYNLSQNIQEDDLQHLELFAEYGRLALEDTPEKPFQKLLFLVRDWSYPYDAEYGEGGGQKILERRLEISEKQHQQLQQLRRHIKACFSEVTCFLMPHPGLMVATNSDFDGRLSDIRDEFKEQLRVLVPQLLSSDHLLPKRIGGRCITAKELITYFKTYVEIFKGDQLPEPKSMLQATAEANNLAALANAKDLYNSTMEAVCGGDRPYLNSAELEKHHLQTKEAALQKFVHTRRMGSVQLSNEYIARLKEELEEMYNSYLRFNDSKKITNALRTPATLFCIIVFSFVNSYLMAALNLTPISFFSNALLAVCLVALVVWSYARYSGDYPSVSEQIDAAVSYLLINFVLPSQRAIMDRVPSEQRMQTELASSSSSSSDLSSSSVPSLHSEPQSSSYIQQRTRTT